MKSLPIDRPTLDDPIYSQKNPHQVFLLVLSILSAFPLLTNGTSASRALDESLTPAGVISWGICLMLGSVLALIGEFWPGHTWNALAVERYGLSLIAVGGLIFICFVWSHNVDLNGVRYVTLLTVAYAGACTWRCVQITRRLRWLGRVIAELELRQRPIDFWGDKK